MSLYVPLGTTPLITGAMARIERRLPQPGEVVVRVGQRVEPEDPVASAFVASPPQIINLARELMLQPARVARALRPAIGTQVNQGDVLATSGGLLGRSCRAPISGVVAAADTETGYVTITPDPVKVDLFANVRGVVMEVLPYEGVRIETPAAQVYGAFGLGTNRSGVLRLLVTDPSEPVLPEQIDARSAYAVLIGGSSITAAALRRAVAEQVRGVIVGGIDEAELRSFMDWASPKSWRTGQMQWQFPNVPEGYDPGLTLVVTEGFGIRSMAAPLFELLASHDRKEALVEGFTHLRSPMRRPRVVIPLSARSANIQLEPPQVVLQPGTLVRLLDHEHMGQVGRVRTISESLLRLPSGARVASVDVLLPDSTIVRVPVSAAEALG